MRRLGLAVVMAFLGVVATFGPGGGGSTRYAVPSPKPVVMASPDQLRQLAGPLLQAHERLRHFSDQLPAYMANGEVLRAWLPTSADISAALQQYDRQALPPDLAEDDRADLAVYRSLLGDAQAAWRDVAMAVGASPGAAADAAAPEVPTVAPAGAAQAMMELLDRAQQWALVPGPGAGASRVSSGGGD